MTTDTGKLDRAETTNFTVGRIFSKTLFAEIAEGQQLQLVYYVTPGDEGDFEMHCVTYFVGMGTVNQKACFSDPDKDKAEAAAFALLEAVNEEFNAKMAQNAFQVAKAFFEDEVSKGTSS